MELLGPIVSRLKRSLTRVCTISINVHLLDPFYGRAFAKDIPYNNIPIIVSTHCNKNK